MAFLGCDCNWAGKRFQHRYHCGLLGVCSSITSRRHQRNINLARHIVQSLSDHSPHSSTLVLRNQHNDNQNCLPTWWLQIPDNSGLPVHDFQRLRHFGNRSFAVRVRYMGRLLVNCFRLLIAKCPTWHNSLRISCLYAEGSQLLRVSSKN